MALLHGPGGTRLSPNRNQRPRFQSSGTGPPAIPPPDLAAPPLGMKRRCHSRTSPITSSFNHRRSFTVCGTLPGAFSPYVASAAETLGILSSGFPRANLNLFFFLLFRWVLDADRLYDFNYLGSAQHLVCVARYSSAQAAADALGENALAGCHQAEPERNRTGRALVASPRRRFGRDGLFFRPRATAASDVRRDHPLLSKAAAAT